MKIVMFSINPLYRNYVTGGASKHLYHVAQHLGSSGHYVEILCAKSVSGADPFLWSDHVRVIPSLPFHLPFPQPYAISGADLALITSRLSDAIQTADRFYIHDGEWLLPDVYQSIPTVISYRDNIYPESVLGTFIGKADDIICISPFSESVIKKTAGRFYPELNQRIHLVRNGIDFDVFSPKDSSALANELGVSPKDEIIILHPHRPEPGKGLPETIQVVASLVHDYHYKNIKALIPEWIGEMVSPGEHDFYQSMMDLMTELKVRSHFVFFPWMPMDRMPELYSLGDVTLCLGKFVETFGNVAYESLACLTPSVVVNVGVHRTLMPDNLLDKVDYGDINQAVEKVARIVEGRSTPWEKITHFLHNHLDFNRQVESYADIILNCRKREPIQFHPPQTTQQQDYQLAPWCYLKDDMIYHDYQAEFESAGPLAELMRENKSITQNKAIEAGISVALWRTWIEKTWIVPMI